MMLSKNCKIILLFTIADLLAIFCYWLHLEGYLPSRFFNLSRDRGFSESISYFKYILIILTLHASHKLTKDQLIKAWVIFFTVLLVDDALGLHELIGKILLYLVSIPTSLPISVKNISEIFGFAVLEGLALLNVARIFFTYNSENKKFSIGLFVALMPLILSGIIMDALPYEMAEQLGEVIGASIVLCYVLISKHTIFNHSN